MTGPARPDYPELADYLGPLRRRWLTVAVLAVIGLALAGAYYYVSPKVYTGTVVVQVNPLPLSANVVGGRTNGAIDMDNEAQLVVSEKVATAAIGQKVGGRAWDTTGISVTALRKDISVVVPPNTSFLQISCQMPTAELARACADAVGTAYLGNRQNTLLTQVSAQFAADQAAVNQLYTGDPTKTYVQTPAQGSLEYLRKQVAALAKTNPRRAALSVQSAALALRVSALQGKLGPLTTLQTSLQAANSHLLGQIVTTAALPRAPSSPRKLLDLPGGLALGLLIGLPLAYFRDRRKPKVYASRDVERRLDVPTLLSLTGKAAGPGTALVPPRSEAGQAFAELAQYVAGSLGDGSHALLIAATGEGSGASSTAANLAAALARTRGETIVVCADLRRSRVPQLLSVPDERGLADLLTGSARLADLLRPVPDADRLRVLTAGTEIGSVLYTLDHDAGRQLVAELQREARYVIIELRDGGNDGTFGLSEFADAAIVVVELGSSEITSVGDCVTRLDRARTPVLGAVLVPGGKRPVARPIGPEVRPVRRAEPVPAWRQQRTPSLPATTMRPVASGKSGTLPAADAEAVRPTGQTERNGGLPAASRPFSEPPDLDSVPLRQATETWRSAGQKRPGSDSDSLSGSADQAPGN